MYNTSSMKKPDNPLVTNIGYFIGENYLFPLTPKGRNGNIRDLYLVISIYILYLRSFLNWHFIIYRTWI